jgi:hypothetical protein
VKKPHPLASVSERVPYAPSERTRKKEKRGRHIPERRRVPERGEGEGTSQGKARGKARPRQGEGEGTSQSNVGERGTSQSMVQKGGGGVVSQKKGMGR